MYINYGDKNFFEHGILVDSEHSDTVFDMLLCEPYSDEEDLYRFAHVQVDISDDWVDVKSVEDYIGMTDETFDPIQFAIGCTEYYSWDNFGADSYGTNYDWRRVSKDVICKELKGYLIANDNLDMEW